jgi:hypothetical protein
MNKANNEYSTSDFPLVASLSLFVPIVRLDASNVGRVVFYFEPTNQLYQLTNDYWNGDLRVDPLRFYSQLKTLKSRLRATIDARGGQQ